MERPNLKVLTNAHVYKIIISKHGDDVVATGVEFEHDGKVHTVSATKEVIASAG